MTGRGNIRRSTKKTGEPVRPDDGPSHVFLLRAIEQVGRAKLGANWSLSLYKCAVPLPVPSWTDVIDVSVATDVLGILRTSHPTLVQNVADSDCGYFANIEWATPEIWHLAVESRAAEIARVVNAKAKLEEAFARLLDDLRSGALTTFTRPVGGGAYTVMEPAIWNFEGWRSRFETGWMDPERPFKPAPEHDDWGDLAITEYVYLFLARDELDRRFQEESRAPDLYGLWPSLSPLMRLALSEAVLIKKDGNEPSAPDLQKRLRERASDYGAVLSPDLAARMVTVIRSPEASKGRKQKKV